MFEKDVNKHYVSDVDTMLEELRKRYSSASQKKEFEHFQKVFELRDNPAASGKQA